MSFVPGTSSRSNSSRFAPSALTRKVTPVTLPPGRLRLETRPSSRTVGANHENDRNGSGCSFGCHRSLRSERNDYGHRVGHQLGGQSRQPVEATIGRAIFDRNVATFDIAGVLQALSDGAEHSIIELSARKQANQRHARLLRARREWPRGRRTAEQRYEVASM